MDGDLPADRATLAELDELGLLAGENLAIALDYDEARLCALHQEVQAGLEAVAQAEAQHQAELAAMPGRVAQVRAEHKALVSKAMAAWRRRNKALQEARGQVTDGTRRGVGAYELSKRTEKVTAAKVALEKAQTAVDAAQTAMDAAVQNAETVGPAPEGGMALRRRDDACRRARRQAVQRRLTARSRELDLRDGLLDRENDTPVPDAIAAEPAGGRPRRSRKTITKAAGTDDVTS